MLVPQNQNRHSQAVDPQSSVPHRTNIVIARYLHMCDKKENKGAMRIIVFSSSRLPKCSHKATMREKRKKKKANGIEFHRPRDRQTDRKAVDYRFTMSFGTGVFGLYFWNL